jgi:hypothetical protein
MKFKLMLFGLSGLALATSAQAGGNLILNGNFALPTSLVEGNGDSIYLRNAPADTIPDWTYHVPGGANNGGIITVLTTSHLNSLGNQDDTVPTDGPYSLWNASNGGTGTIVAPPSHDHFVLGQDSAPENAAYLTQTINGLTNGKTYLLTFEFAGAQLRNADGTMWNGATNEGVEVNLGGTYDTAVADGGTTSQKYTGGQTDVAYYDNFNTSIASHSSTPWQQVKMYFTANGSSEDLNLEAISTSSGNPPFALIDNLSLLAVPEPATWAMVILGVFGIGAIVRRRRSGRLAAA